MTNENIFATEYQIIQINVDKHPISAAIDHDIDRIFVVNKGNSTVSVINGNTNKVTILVQNGNLIIKMHQN